MDKIVNLRLLSHPINWAIVLIVVLISSFAWREVTMLTTGSCGCSDIPD